MLQIVLISQGEWSFYSLDYTHLTTTSMTTDMRAIPSPFAETKMISIKSLFRLKYCPMIIVPGSRVMATPKPRK